MSKFNQKSEGIKTTSMAGGIAYRQKPEQELMGLIMTSMLSGDSYYEKESDRLKRMNQLLYEVDPEFAAKVVVYTRQEIGLRSITHASAAELATALSGKSFAKDFYRAVVRRVDDITEILSYQKGNGRKISSAMKKGLAESFSKFDRYQLAKYQGKGKSISLVDAVNMLHPKPTINNATALSELVIHGKLRSENTFEAKLSQAGKSENKKEAKEKAWEELVLSERIGYFALLRNLRNIESEAPQVIEKACEIISNKHKVRKSGIFPFQFATALSHVGDRRLISALYDAVEYSVDNFPELPGSSLVAIDYSGSMGRGSDISSPRSMATIFGIAAAKKNGSDIMIFGSTAADIGYNPKSLLMDVHNKMSTLNNVYGGRGGEGYVGHGTNFSSIFQTTKKYDRVFIFSDAQSWIGETEQARSNYAHDMGVKPFVYCFDLSGYGTTQFGHDYAQIPSLSDKVFDVVNTLEGDRDALIKKIDAVKFEDYF